MQTTGLQKRAAFTALAIASPVGDANVRLRPEADIRVHVHSNAFPRTGIDAQAAHAVDSRLLPALNGSGIRP